jgi:hypothetical protein
LNKNEKMNLIRKDRFLSQCSKQGVNLKQIPGFDNYFITDRRILVDGNWIDVVKNKGEKFRIVAIRPARKDKKYLTFDVYYGENSSKKQLLLHRARLITFAGDRGNDKLIVRHLNGDAADNKLDNLEWGTHTENMNDMKVHGSKKGSNNPASAITENEAVALYILSHLTVLNNSNHDQFCSLSKAQIYKIKKMKAWAHAINENIQNWVRIAVNLQTEKSLKLENKFFKQKNLQAEKGIKEIKNVALQELKELKNKIEQLAI